MDIVFTNTGSTSCTLYGYPGVSLGTGSPLAQVGTAATRSPNGSAKTVTLKPGDSGSALLRVVAAQNYPSGTCTPKAVSTLQVYPPNQTTAIDLSFKGTGCASTKVSLLTIGVAQAGANAVQQ